MRVLAIVAFGERGSMASGGLWNRIVRRDGGDFERTSFRTSSPRSLLSNPLTITTKEGEFCLWFLGKSIFMVRSEVRIVAVV